MERRFLSTKNRVNIGGWDFNLPNSMDAETLCRLRGVDLLNAKNLSLLESLGENKPKEVLAMDVCGNLVRGTLYHLEEGRKVCCLLV